MSNQHGIEQVIRVVEQFEVTDLGAPFKVVLHKSVEAVFDADGTMIRYDIPDYSGLEREIAWARLTHFRKLKGAEVKFIRKLVGVTQQAFAAAVSLTPEHVSKVENGHSVLSPSTEKLARIFFFKSASKMKRIKSEDMRKRVEKGIDSIFEDLVPVCVSPIEDELRFDFICARNVKIDSDPANDNLGVWDHGPMVSNAS